MKRLIPKYRTPIFPNSIHELQDKTLLWIDELQFIQKEQFFFNSLMEECIMEHCSLSNWKQAKLLLSSIQNETELATKLLIRLKNHKMNLGLLLQHIYTKREDQFRDTHRFINNEFKNYVENYRCLKDQLFTLVLSELNRNNSIIINE